MEWPSPTHPLNETLENKGLMWNEQRRLSSKYHPLFLTFHVINTSYTCISGLLFIPHFLYLDKGNSYFFVHWQKLSRRVTTHVQSSKKKQIKWAILKLWKYLSRNFENEIKNSLTPIKTTGGSFRKLLLNVMSH